MPAPGGATKRQPPAAPVAGVLKLPPTLRAVSVGHCAYTATCAGSPLYGSQSPQVPLIVYVPAAAGDAMSARSATSPASARASRRLRGYGIGSSGGLEELVAARRGRGGS